MRQIALPNSFYKAQPYVQATQQASKEATQRQNTLLAVRKTKQKFPNLSIQAICDIKGIPRATCYRYLKSYQENSISALEPKSRTPKTTRTPLRTPLQEQKILEVRKELPRASKYKGTSKNSNFAPDSVFFTEPLCHERKGCKLLLCTACDFSNALRWSIQKVC